jgi:NitT/TauT family transport system substrate-binding protein
MKLSRATALGMMSAALVPARARADEITTIRVVGPPSDGFKEAYYGISAGIFRKYGVSVQITLSNSGAVAAAALTGGAAEIAYTNLLTLIKAHLHGVPMQCVTAATWYLSDRPGAAMLALKDSPLKSARDLNGLTLGVQALGDINSAGVLAWIDQNGGDAKMVKMVEVPPSATEAALEQGRVATVTMTEPTVSRALAGGKVRVFAHPLDAIAKRFQASAYAAMGPVVAQNMDVMSRFARHARVAGLYERAS